MAEPQFVLLSLGDNARVGGTVRVVGVAVSEDAGKAQLDALDPSVLGHIALVEVKQHFERRPTVQSVAIDKPLFADDR
jgi:hypothetical protein